MRLNLFLLFRSGFGYSSCRIIFLLLAGDRIWWVYVVGYHIKQEGVNPGNLIICSGVIFRFVCHARCHAVFSE